MTATEMLDLMGKMTNREKQEFLDKLYYGYFHKGVPVNLMLEDVRIIQLYRSGDLVECNDDYY